jgi:hypothetical protein
MQMVRNVCCSRWCGVLVAAVFAAGLLLVPVARADINGFKNGKGWTTNSNFTPPVPPTFNGASLQITTDGMGEQHNTSFYLSPQIVIGSWVASFTYTVGGSMAADGATFCIQNDPAGPAAGTNQDGGSALGYQGIDNSVAVAFNVFSTSNPAAGGSGHAGETDLLYLSNALGAGVQPGGSYTNDPTVDGNPPFSLVGGDTIQVTLSFDPIGANITQTLMDTTTGGTAKYVYPIDISLVCGCDNRNPQTPPGYLGTAFVGFTGGTGGSTSTQTFADFTFTEFP